jgi:zinc-binding alcohol dehydrogenase/oxidoreductase
MRDLGCVRAMLLERPGDPPRFVASELADEAPGADEVAVELRAAALNRRDWWIWRRRDGPQGALLGSDGAGVVRAVGAGVEDVRVGDEVVVNPALGWRGGEGAPGEGFSILGHPSRGTFATRIVIAAANVAARPPHLTWNESAALPLAGLTAWRACVTLAEAGQGRTLLVTAAGSGVSTFAVQIAAALGARVFVTSGSDAKLERARALGAAGGVIYREPDWPARLRELAGGGVDAVVDSYGDWPALMAALRPGGTIVSFGDTGMSIASVAVADLFLGWKRICGTTMGSPREFAAMLAHVGRANWRPVIDSTYPIDRIAEAAARLDAPGRFGKVVLEIA